MGKGFGAWCSCVAIVITGGHASGVDCEPAWTEAVAPAAGDDGGSALGSLSVLSKDDIWAAGNYGQRGGRRALVEHWDGKAWKVVPCPDGDKRLTYLTGIAAAATDDAWVVGYTADAIVGESLSETVIERWDGGSWKLVSSPNLVTADVSEEFGGYPVSNELYAVAVVSKDDVWAVGRSYTIVLGQDLIVHWDGKSWSVVPSPHPGQSAWLRSVVSVSPTDVWALGEYYKQVTGGAEVGGAVVQQNLIEHWDGLNWTVVESPNDGPSVNGIWSASVITATDIWAVGYHLDIFSPREVQQPTVLRWDGVEWSLFPVFPVNHENNYLRSVSTLSTGDVYLVGFYDTGPPLPVYDTTVFHWDGFTWNLEKSVDPAKDNELYAVAAVGTDDIWAVGQGFLEELPYGTLIEHYTQQCAQAAFVRGDANADGKVDLSDAVATLTYLFQGDLAPACLDALDVDDNGGVEITDPIYLLSYLFQGGAAPPAPYPDPGEDPTPDGLLCPGPI